MKKKGSILLVSIAFLSMFGNVSIKASGRTDINKFIGYYRVDIDDSVEDYNCEIRELEFIEDGQLQEVDGLAAATTGTTTLYRFTDYQIIGNVLEGSYDSPYGYAENDFEPLSGYSSGKHQMLLTEEGNIISDGHIWYRYDKNIE